MFEKALAILLVLMVASLAVYALWSFLLGPNARGKPPTCEHCRCIEAAHQGYGGRLGCVAHPSCPGWAAVPTSRL